MILPSGVIVYPLSQLFHEDVPEDLSEHVVGHHYVHAAAMFLFSCLQKLVSHTQVFP